MNRVFMVVFGLLLLLSLIKDARRSKELKARGKQLITFLYLLTVALLVCLQYQVTLYLPTNFFVNVISPKVYWFIHRNL
jgi:hypothetical protein